MNTKDLPHVSTETIHDPPRRAMSRAPANHNVTMTLLGCATAAVILAILWAFYVYA